MGTIRTDKSKPADDSIPTPFVALRAGFVRILRLRLVDCFGQFLDLAGSSDSSNIDLSQLIESETCAGSRRIPASLRCRHASLRPAGCGFATCRPTAPKTEANDTVSPVCGFLVPNHLDGDLEFFDAAGTNLGVVRPDPEAGIVWEEAPGQPSTVGQSPERAIPNSFCRRHCARTVALGLGGRHARRLARRRV